ECCGDCEPSVSSPDATIHNGPRSTTEQPMSHRLRRLAPILTAGLSAALLAACAENGDGGAAPEPGGGPGAAPDGGAAASGAAASGAAADNAAAPAFARKPAPAGASVYIIEPEDGAVVSNPVRVVFGLRGMGVAPAGIAQGDAG